jgi:alpha-N-acetylglucosaminidase
MIGRRRVVGYGIATGALGVIGAAVGLTSQSVARGSRPHTGAVDASSKSQVFDPGPARRVLQRLLTAAQANQIELLAVAGTDGVDRYRIRTPDAAGSGGAGSDATTATTAIAVTIEGTSTTALLAGTAHYLKYLAGITISLPGDSLAALPEQLPSPKTPTPVSGAAAVNHRFALNDTENGYAGAYRTWSDWERTLDVLALHGFTEVLIPAGQDEVYRRVFTEFGYSLEELDGWIPAPSHQPWWLLGNVQGVLGTPDPQLGNDTDAAARQHGVAVVQQAVSRLRELGLTPVLPGYHGLVPKGFGQRNPDAHVVGQGEWDDYPRPDWLDPRDPHFARVAESFYRHQAELYGPSTAYKMDLLHEGGETGGVPMGDAAVAVMTALQTARPGATWVMLGWEGNPRRDVLETLRACGVGGTGAGHADGVGVGVGGGGSGGSTICAKGRVLIVDGCSDRFESLDREADWGGTDYAFGVITNFGGRSLLGANAATWSDRYPKALATPGSALTGIAWMPEATGHDPAAFELFAELGWRTDGFELSDWFGRYAARRYGRADKAATQAWQAFAGTVYALAPGRSSEAQDSLFSAWPDLSAVSAAPGGPDLRYDAAAFQRAVTLLLEADPALQTIDAYRYDVVDFTRQALANHARVLLPQIKAAYVAHDLTGYRSLTTRWLDAMNLLDQLLATDARFLLGTWLRTGGYDARSLITTWGGRAQAEQLHNYGGRELAGLVADVYIPRWRTHFGALEAVVAGAAKTWTQTDWFAVDDAWAHSPQAYPATATGDPFAVANTILSFLAAS